MTRLPSILLAPHHDNDDHGESAKEKECGNDDNGDNTDLEKAQMCTLTTFWLGKKSTQNPAKTPRIGLKMP